MIDTDSSIQFHLFARSDRTVSQSGAVNVIMTSYPLPVTCEAAAAEDSVASPTDCGILCKTVIGWSGRGFAKSHRLSSSSSSTSSASATTRTQRPFANNQIRRQCIHCALLVVQNRAWLSAKSPALSTIIMRKHLARAQKSMSSHG